MTSCRITRGRFNKGGLERWPFERFYCGCPLVTTNGFRVGTLCLGGDSPRKMSAHEVRRLSRPKPLCCHCCAFKGCYQISTHAQWTALRQNCGV